MATKKSTPEHSSDHSKNSSLASERGALSMYTPVEIKEFKRQLAKRSKLIRRKLSKD